jgi:hypothetical protein
MLKYQISWKYAKWEPSSIRKDGRTDEQTWRWYGRAHIETQADAGQGDAARETLCDTVWAHIETQADAGQRDAARETLRDTVWAHNEK